ncbi:TRAP transporter large permease [uncultured Eubacterium sp.]|uniref:TRAP transporter large permease n=1 Tax=uncultured Eubacterium sp. TaxID=165185 RepID=UPI0025975448|nr:TRAP transporter large permease subunit [uncultured Eubacterium sp.]
MSSIVVIGIAMFILMIVMALIGIPIFVDMLVCSFLGFYLMGGMKMVVTQFMQAPFAIGASYTYAVLPLFVLVGTLAGVTGIAQGAFNAMQNWLGRFKGGLLYALVASNAVFGACSGISIAGNVVFGKIAMPELERHKYDRKLSLGAIVGAGSLSSLIPPSVPIIMWCLLTNLSIGTTLMYGLSVGIIMIILLCIAIRVFVAIFPKKIPSTSDMEKIPLKEKIISLQYLVPIILVFALIVGGTLGGFFSSTVAGAVAAVALIIFALVKKVPVKQIGYCIWDAAVMNAGIFPIIIAGTIFSRFVTLTRLADTLANMIAEANIPMFAVFCMVVVFYLLCGCVMDINSTIIITVPIVFPLLTGLGYNPYIICVLLVMLCECAGMTPPIGMNVFAVSNALRIKASEIFAGVWPFFLINIVAIFIMALFPQLIEFIPHLLGVA